MSKCYDKLFTVIASNKIKTMTIIILIWQLIKYINWVCSVIDNLILKFYFVYVHYYLLNAIYLYIYDYFNVLFNVVYYILELLEIIRNLLHQKPIFSKIDIGLQEQRTKQKSTLQG